MTDFNDRIEMHMNCSEPLSHSFIDMACIKPEVHVSSTTPFPSHYLEKFTLYQYVKSLHGALNQPKLFYIIRVKTQEGN